MVADNITIGENGHLLFAHQDTVRLAKEYGTPLYLLDEDKIRENCRIYSRAFKKHFGKDSHALYASKANSFKRIYEIMAEEDMGIDVVSPGEIYTANKAGFPLKKAFFHGNNKTDADIAYAMEQEVGYFVIDNMEEIEAVEAEAAKRGITQKALLRVSPGIDPHTFEEVSTGKVDSKFGLAIATGAALDGTREILKKSHIEFMGFHCHVGSQVFGEDVFERTAAAMLEFVAAVKASLGYEARVLNLGGGYGVRYLDTDPYLDVDGKVASVAKAIKDTCSRLDIKEPEIHMEPGRSIVAAAGMTLYTVGTVKQITGYKNYVSVDGSMADHPRFALYGSKYTILPADKMTEVSEFQCSVVGRCCESGDIIYDDVKLPASMKRGDILAVCTTGAYHYSMSSNYNRLLRPAVVMLRGGTESYLAVKRETFEDLVRNDI